MILTKEFLRNKSDSSYMAHSSTRQEVLNENRRLFASAHKYDIFLSHSYLDQTLVYTLLDLFNKSGYSVYVDWIVDSQLDRSQVNKETSRVLRDRINSSKSLAYIATSNSSQSKWCPWELGYEDGKSNGRCAILPVLEYNTSNFSGQEYLGIYPYLEYETKANSSEYEFWVIDSDYSSKYIILSSWLNGIDPIQH